MASVQLQHALDFLTFIDNRDYAALASLLSENFTHCFLPASLGGLGMPSRNKQQFFDLLIELQATFERFNFQRPKEVIENKDVVVIHTTSDGKTTSGKSYNNEYTFTVHFDDEKKITSVKEFLDSKYVTEVLERENSASGKVA